MHGERDGRTLSSPSPSMFTDESSKVENNPASGSSSTSHNPSTELAYLPIGCAVSAKYRGAFCSAKVKAIEKLVKLKVTVVESNETITIQEEQIVQSAPLRIGNTVTIRLNSSNRRQSNDSNSHSHYSRSGLAAFIHTANPDEKQATIKQIIDNSIYTVVFDDGDEKSLRRSSLCLQGIRLYQTQYGQQKILEEIPTSASAANTTTAGAANTASSSTSPSPSLPASSETANVNDIASIMAIQRQGSSDQPVFPALVLKRKALADYMWVRSFADGREYIVHTRDDAQPYQNNSDIQALCRSTSREATQACEKFLKYNHIPAVWQKKKKKQSKNGEQHGSTDEDNSSADESSSDDDEEDDDEIDEETAEEKDSFVAQLFAFMDDRGTPINNIPKVQNYDLDLHRLFKIVRLFGGYNKVTKNDQWDKVHIKMGLPDETSTENGRSIEHAYKKYLFAYEDLSKKLGSMNAPSAYFGGRTSMGSDSRRSLIRVRQQQEEEKNAKKAAKPKATPASVKQRGRKSLESRPSVDSKPTPSSAKKPPPAKPSTPASRKVPIKTKPANVLSSGSSESDSDSDSETSDDDSSSSSASNYDDNRKTKGKAAQPASSAKKSPAVSSAPSSSSVSKKVPQIASSKTEPKKTSTTSKPASNDSKQSKLTITIPIAKSKTPNVVQSVKKPQSSAISNNDEKKKLSTPKLESRSISAPSPKKPLSTPSKTSQIIKTNPTSKQSSNESSKITSTSNKTSTSTAPLPFKQKPTISQTSTNSSNKDRSVSKSTPSSVDSRQGKPTKISSSSTKSSSDDRSNSVPTKKPKPIIKEEVHSKPMSSPSTMKIPKLSSSSNDPTKKSTILVDKLPKKPLPKEGAVKPSKIPESTSKSNTEQPVKPHTASPTRQSVVDTVKKPPPPAVSPVPVPPKSPSPPPPPPIVSAISPISEEAITPMNVPPPISTTPTPIAPYEDTPDVKPADVPLVFQPVTSTSISLKESNGHTSPSSTSTKRPHSDDHTETAYTSSTISDTDEQLSPLKRARRSMSSQESIDTLSSSDQPPISDHLATHRNTALTYEEIAVNDVLLVTWGSNGGKLYPARCSNKNDEKNELFVHYTGYNSRHDEWIKLDRVVERKDSSNGQALLQPRPRRTSQISTLRQQHTDSTNSSLTGPNSNEPVHQQHVPLINPSIVDATLLSTLGTDDDQQQQLLRSQSLVVNRTSSIEKSKPMDIDESDLDDNSQENNRPWPQLETISSTEDDALSSTSTNRTSQSDLKLLAEAIIARRCSSTTAHSTENILSAHHQHDFQAIDDSDQELGSISDREHPKPRLSRATSVTNRIDPTSAVKCELTEAVLSQASDLLKRPHHYPIHVKEETIDVSSMSHQVPVPLTLKIEPVPPSTNILSSPPTTISGNRRASARQLKRRTLREPNTSRDSPSSMKKRTRFDNGSSGHGDSNADSGNNSDQATTRSNSTEQQIADNITARRNRPSGRRGGKRSVTQQEYENEDYRSNSPSYITMRQQLKEMFKHRPSRYNFLDLNNNLAGDERIVHLKDRMRECQKVFFNLKSALVKVEKQRKVFLRKQKPLINVTTTAIQPTSSEILTTSTCI